MVNPTYTGVNFFVNEVIEFSPWTVVSLQQGWANYGSQALIHVLKMKREILKNNENQNLFVSARALS
jgi:hypothetical protein